MNDTWTAETLDRNKTAITHRVTATAAAYLDGLGCKPVETEVSIRPGWIADLASYWYPTHTEAKRLHLNSLARKIMGNEANTYNPIERAWGDGPFTMLVEVKTSKSDFARDAGKWKQWPAHLCFIAYPTGLLTPDDIPPGWYGMQTTKDGTGVYCIHRSSGSPFPPHAQHAGSIIDFLAAVGIRRDHRTRNVAIRNWAKAYRAKEGGNRTEDSLGSVLHEMARWMQDRQSRHKNLADVLRSCGYKELPRYCDAAVAYLESLKTARDGEEKA